jgi:hypothetical protein
METRSLAWCRSRVVREAPFSARKCGNEVGLRRVLLAALMLCAVACDKWLTTPGLYNTVTVIVTTRNGSPVPRTALTLYTGQRPMGYATTDATGRYMFQDVPQGDYGVLASPPAGYDVIEHLIGGPSTLVQDKLNVAGDTLSPVRFTFLKRGPGTLVARVVQPNGVPISGVSVTAYAPTTIDGKAVTDAAGFVVFQNVPFGVHGLIAQRPFLYRDFLTPGDSLYAVRDNLIVDAGSNDTTIFRLARCAGTVRTSAVDGAGLPVAGVTSVFYTSSQQLALLVTGADGFATFTSAPCATQLGVLITPAAGYTVADGRGSRFIDGLTVANNATVDVVFHLTKTP